VVGKFAPLHRGHELVIECALASCDEVVVISYSKPEMEGCAPESRANWLAARFPQTRRLVVSDETVASRLDGSEFVEVPANGADAEIHRRFVAHLCRCVLEIEIDAVFTSEDYGDGFAATLESEQRRYSADAPSVRHVCVDRARSAVPVSATRIRADVHAHRHWLAPEVYASFVKRVCILGGESSGKSTLAERLAAALRTIHVPEYGRALWEERAGVLTFGDLRSIGDKQIGLEDEAAKCAREFLICDTSPLTTLFYSEHLFARADPALRRLAQSHRYHTTVLCAPDFPFVQDGTRQDDAFRHRQHRWYVDQLTARGEAWLLVDGSVAERVQRVCAHLNSEPVVSAPGS